MAKRNSNRYVSSHGKEDWIELEKICSMGYSRYNVFSDWVDLILNSLLSLTDNLRRDKFVDKFMENKFDGKYEERYMSIVQKYKENKSIYSTYIMMRGIMLV